MSKHREECNIELMGIDLAKRSFQLHGLDRIGWYDKQIKQIAETEECARRLLTIPGIGPMIATGLLSAIGDIHAFKNGRELAAWMGLVPLQHSTGGKQRLLDQQAR